MTRSEAALDFYDDLREYLRNGEPVLPAFTAEDVAWLAEMGICLDESEDAE